MLAPGLTTTLSELNRLYGLYFEAIKGTPNVQQAMRAWIDYEQYARRYNRERGLWNSLPSLNARPGLFSEIKLNVAHDLVLKTLARSL
jgi:hypothetical protein